MVKCQKCKVSFPIWEDWERHVRNVERLFPCTVRLCQRAFSTRAVANNHVDSYHHGWRLVCPVCDAAYSDPSSFRKHRDRSADVRCKTSVASKRQIGPRREMVETPVRVIAQEGPMNVVIPHPRIIQPVVGEGGKCWGFLLLLYNYSFSGFSSISFFFFLSGDAVGGNVGANVGVDVGGGVGAEPVGGVGKCLGFFPFSFSFISKFFLFFSFSR